MRLGFAVAAFLEPEILVVDEVLAVGDAEFQKKAPFLLFVSHNMASEKIQPLCKKRVLLEHGMKESYRKAA